MLDEMQRLAESESMRRLLDHYAAKGVDDRMVGHDRLMALESITAAELTKLHGELLTAEWVEMNVGFTSGKCPGGVAACYRVTVAGLRAWKRTQGGFYLEDEEDEANPTANKPRLAQRGGKRSRKETAQPTENRELTEVAEVARPDSHGGEGNPTSSPLPP